MSATRSLKARANRVVARLAEEYPGTARELCALEHRDAFQLLVATILSAQCTDVRVNMVTRDFFLRYPDAPALAGADPQQVEELIKPTGFFRSKARSLLGMSSALVERFGAEVPSDLADLVTLPGVGRKTGNVVRSVAFDLPGLPVDTHVGRIARRLGLTTSQDPDRVEEELGSLVSQDEWGTLSVRLILHGRQVCTSRAPKCDRCVLADICPKIGVDGAAGGGRSSATSSKISVSPRSEARNRSREAPKRAKSAPARKKSARQAPARARSRARGED